MGPKEMEILRGVLAVAVADGHATRGEKGVIEGLAKRAGVDPAWLRRMTERAEQGRSVESSMSHPVLEDPAQAMKLLVGVAAIDGEITEAERSALVDIGLKIGLPSDQFGEVFEEGMATADKLRKKRKR